MATTLSRLKFINKYWVDGYKILYRHLDTQEDEGYYTFDFLSNATMRLVLIEMLMQFPLVQKEWTDLTFKVCPTLVYDHIHAKLMTFNLSCTLGLIDWEEER